MSRTYFVVAGDDSVALAKALSHGADALVVDLVAGAADPAATRAVAGGFTSTPAVGTELWIRANPGPVGHDDAREVIAAGGVLHGVFVARTESPVQLDAMDSVLSTVEAEAGLPARSLGLVPSLESAGSVLAAAAIARAPRVLQLFLNEDEIVAELGLTPSPDEHELLWLRSQVVFASAAAGLTAPIASAPSTVDSSATLRSTMELRRLGFGGRTCVSPDHVALVEEVFRPSLEELAAARDVLERWSAATRDGLAICRDADGRAIDEARLRRAHRTLGRP